MTSLPRIKREDELSSKSKTTVNSIRYIVKYTMRSDICDAFQEKWLFSKIWKNVNFLIMIIRRVIEQINSLGQKNYFFVTAFLSHCIDHVFSEKILIWENVPRTRIHEMKEQNTKIEAMIKA